MEHNYIISAIYPIKNVFGKVKSIGSRQYNVTAVNDTGAIKQAVAMDRKSVINSNCNGINKEYASTFTVYAIDNKRV